MRRKLRQLIICHDTNPNNVNKNYEHHNDINNIDTDKNSDVDSKIRRCDLTPRTTKTNRDEIKRKKGGGGGIERRRHGRVAQGRGLGLEIAREWR